MSDYYYFFYALNIVLSFAVVRYEENLSCSKTSCIQHQRFNMKIYSLSETNPSAYNGKQLYETEYM